MKIQKPNSSKNQQYKVFALAERKANGELCCILETSEVSATLTIDKLQTARLFSRLLAAGRIQQLQRGVYLFPGRIPPGRKWKPAAYLALANYMKWRKTKWQISGLDAMSRHGLTTQVPQKIFVYNTAYSGEKEVGGSQFVFVKMPKKHFGNAVTLLIPNSKLRLTYSSKARTLFDLVFEHSRLKKLTYAYLCILKFCGNKKFINELIDCAIAYGNLASQQRIGFLLNAAKFNGKKLNELRSIIGEYPTPISLLPPTRSGLTNKEWGIIESIPVKQLIEESKAIDEINTR